MHPNEKLNFEIIFCFVFQTNKKSNKIFLKQLLPAAMVVKHYLTSIYSQIYQIEFLRAVKLTISVWCINLIAINFSGGFTQYIIRKSKRLLMLFYDLGP